MRFSYISEVCLSMLRVGFTRLDVGVTKFRVAYGLEAGEWRLRVGFTGLKVGVRRFWVEFIG